MSRLTFVLMPLLVACSASVSTETPAGSAVEGLNPPAAMTSTDPAPNTHAAPAWARTEIDRVAPARFETATFALG